MARKLLTTNPEIANLLNILADTNTGSEKYRMAMYSLGRAFGEILLPKLDSQNSVSLASTVEDADFLARGIINVFEEHEKKVMLTVFWNKRFKPFPDNAVAIAPILKEYREDSLKQTDTVIVVKSIIADSCVVRTNLTRLIEETYPQKIFIVAPVLLKGAKTKLEEEFEPGISRLFEYLCFAEDDERKEGIVIPGIGGDIYTRLGFTDQNTKNRYIPQVVKLRRSASAQ